MLGPSVVLLLVKPNELISSRFKLDQGEEGFFSSMGNENNEIVMNQLIRKYLQSVI